ncbi:MAG: polysaccharide deacetylase family protein, partial [Oscillospiraceae bacterium]
MKIYVCKQKTATLVVGILAVCAIFYAVAYPAVTTVSATERQLPIYCVEVDQKVCAISFDAAWGNEDTQHLIDILEKYQIKATFFVVGDWAVKYPDSVKALADAGHEVMNHSDTHRHFNALSADEIVADVTRCNEKVAAVTGVAPTLIRCPYGEYDDHVVAAIRALGMEPIQWDVEPSATPATHGDAGDARGGLRPLFEKSGAKTFAGKCGKTPDANRGLPLSGDYMKRFVMPGLGGGVRLLL